MRVITCVITDQNVALLNRHSRIRHIVEHLKVRYHNKF